MKPYYEEDKLIFLSLCSGGGGLDLGLERSGLKCVGQVEINPYGIAVLNKHFPKVPKHTNIYTLFALDSLAKIYLGLIPKQSVLKAKEALSSLNVGELSTRFSALDSMLIGFLYIFLKVYP